MSYALCQTETFLINKMSFIFTESDKEQNIAKVEKQMIKVKGHFQFHMSNKM